jgi:nitrile hydratase beta subunit
MLRRSKTNVRRAKTMKGGHDLGGRQGLGPINPELEAEEPVFHTDWERRVFAMTLATGMLGQWNIDESRFARESQHPADYLRNSYYENWLVGIQNLLVKKGLLTEGELAAACMITDGAEELRVPNSEDAIKILGTGGPTLMPSDGEPEFSVGDAVRAKKIHTKGHSRLPTYVQGSVGEIEENYGCHVYPDKNSAGERIGEFLYRVRFSSASLWGSSEDNSEVLIDLWQPYLENVE